jgi:hypothetical protein
MEERIRQRIAQLTAERVDYEREAITRLTAYDAAISELAKLLENETDGRLNGEETQSGKPVGSAD